jgi:signal peptidase I
MTGRRVERVVLALGAVLGSLCLVTALAAAAFDLRPLVFRSGSMAPSIETGDLAVAQEVAASELGVGDVVSVKTASGSRVTHRIVTVTKRDGHATLALKGDANSATDAEPYDVETADRVLFSVPAGGYVLAWLAGPMGIFLLGGYAVWLLMRVARPRPRLSEGHLSEGGRAGLPVLATVAVVGMLAGAGSQASAPWTLAAWTDAVGVSGTTLTAYTVPPSPSFTCGSLGVFSVKVNWTAVAGATDYTVHYGSGGATTLTTTSTTATITSAISGGTAWVQVNRTFGPVTWTSVASQTRTYTVAVASLCS